MITYLLNNYKLPAAPQLDVSFEELLTTNKGKRRAILSTSSKFSKEDGYITAGLYLDPSWVGLCPFKGACAKTCLVFSGHMIYHMDKRRALTIALLKYPKLFVEALVMELKMKAFEAKLLGKGLGVRLNGTSDIRWELVIDLELLSRELRSINEDVFIYDYTKFPIQHRAAPSFYSLTYSIDENVNSYHRARYYLDEGYNVAIVLNNKDYKRALAELPHVIDGEKNDHRFLEHQKVVVLKAKVLRSHKGARPVYSDDGIIRSFDDALYLSEYIDSLQSLFP